jgi:hypothetical protein
MSDLFTQQSSIVARLASQVTSTATYYGSQVVGANSEPIKSGIFVAPGEAVLLDASVPARTGGALERHAWRVICRATMNTGAATAATRVEHTLGTLCYSVVKALEGYRLTTGSPDRLRYIGHDEMLYDVAAGYAEVNMKFSADMAIS